MKNLEESVELSARLGCKVNQAFEMFTNKEHLSSWLPIVTCVEPKEGGKYEISWTKKKPSIQCKILIYIPNYSIVFEWNGPPDGPFMHSSELDIEVTIYFLPMDDEKKTDRQFTDVHLVLTIMNDPYNDEDIKSWFENSWATAFEKLVEHVNDTFQ